MSRFLIVRLGALGDIVHAIPVAAALRRALSAGADRLAGQRQASRDPRSRAGHRSSSGRSTIVERPAGGGTSLVSAIRRAAARALRRRASICRGSSSPRCSRGCPARRASSGSSSSYSREALARLFYTEVARSGRGGLYDAARNAACRRHQSGTADAARDRRAGVPEFPIEAADSAAARWAQRATERPLRAAQSRRRMAEQAMAAVAAGGGRERARMRVTG